MPSKSPVQARLMAAVAHSPEFAQKVGIPQSVGQEFNQADKSLSGLRRFMPHFAEGGRPAVNQPAIVGENGPEMFVPDRPGTVVPSSPLGALLRLIAPRNPQETEEDRARQGKSLIGNTLRAVAPR